MASAKPSAAFTSASNVPAANTDVTRAKKTVRRKTGTITLVSPPRTVRRQSNQVAPVPDLVAPMQAMLYFGALLVGFYEGKSFKFAGRVGTGFSEKLLRSLFDDLQKIRVESCPFYNLPAPGRNRWDQGLSAAEMKRCRWVKPAMVCQVKFTEWTRDDRLRQPMFLGIREDKSPTDVVREKAS